MSTDLDRSLEASLAQHAGDAAAPDDLAARAIAAGHRRRSRRRAATVVVVTAAVAGGTLGAAALFHHRASDPATAPHAATSSSTVTTHLPMAQRTPLDDLGADWNDELPVGASVDITPRLEVGLDGQVAVVTRSQRTALGADAGARYAILDPEQANLLVTRRRMTSPPTPSDWTLLDIAGDGSVTEVAVGAARGTAFEGGLITGAARDPGGSGAYAISTLIDPNITPDGPDFLYLVQPGEPPTARHSMGLQSGQVLGWTSRGVLVNTDAGVQLWAPQQDRLTLIYGHDDPLARVLATNPSLVLVHREMDYGPEEDTIEPGSCLELLDVRTGTVREITCGDDPPGATRTPHPNAVNPEATIVMASNPMTLAGARVRQRVGEQSVASWGVFPQQRFLDTYRVVKPVAQAGTGWWQWWVRCDVRTASCEQAPLPRGIRAISLYESTPRER
ncbi:MAG: hypothetical protein V9G19_25795 [Tetrasphaera sp.]